MVKDNQSTYHDSGYCLNYGYNEYVTKHAAAPQQHPPELRTIKKDFIDAAISALQSGLEYAQECLIRHDENLGRTIARNKREAEYIEEEISKIKTAIENLK
jgi:hypothetical protein